MVYPPEPVPGKASKEVKMLREKLTELTEEHNQLITMISKHFFMEGNMRVFPDQVAELQDVEIP
jgi:hypothetical protein|tara:strand:+ start:323 stop:514 length:192 start_codon:yes stop_codon:yes gene_type:complete